jgi:hypothetical protein
MPGLRTPRILAFDTGYAVALSGRRTRSTRQTAADVERTENRPVPDCRPQRVPKHHRARRFALFMTSHVIDAPRWDRKHRSQHVAWPTTVRFSTAGGERSR